MMQTTAAHHHTGGDPNQPCGKCHKRHVRAGEGIAPSSQPSNKNRRGLYLTTSSPSIKKTAGILALFLSAAITHPASAAAVTGSQPSSAVMASEASRQHIFDGTAMSSVLASLWGINHKKSTTNNRFLQVEEDDHDHDHDHDHADEIHSVVGGTNETDLHDLHAAEHHDEPGHTDEHVEGNTIVEHHDEHDHDGLHHADEAAAMKLDEVDHHDEHDDHSDVHDDHGHGDVHDDHGDEHDDHGHGGVSAYFIPQYLTPFSLKAYILLTHFLTSPATYSMTNMLMAQSRRSCTVKMLQERVVNPGGLSSEQHYLLT